MNKNLFTKITALFLCFLIALGQPSGKFVQASGNEPYNEETVIRMLDENLSEMTEQNPNGLFSFATPAYGVKRDVVSFDIYILRFGGTKGRVKMDITTTDMSATYGKDYDIKLKDGLFYNKAEKSETAMQFLPTEDMHEKDRILISDQYTQALEDGQAVAPKSEQEIVPESEQEIVPESEQEIAPKSEQEIVPESEQMAELVTMQSEQTQNIAEPKTLKEMKSTLFNKNVEQTNSFYTDNGSDLGKLPEMTVKQVIENSVLPSSNLELTFEDGERYKVITATIHKATSAGDETFSLNMSMPEMIEGDGIPICGTYQSTSVVIKHEGSVEEGIISFKETDVYTTAGNEYAEVTLIRQGGTYTPATVYFTTVSDTAKPTEDYSPVQRTILFMPGDTEIKVKIPLLINEKDDRSFLCRLENAEGASVSVAESTIHIQSRDMILSALERNEIAFAANSNNTETLRWSSFYNLYKTKNTYSEWGYADKDAVWYIGSGHHSGWDERVNYGIIRADIKIPTVAYKSITVNFDSRNYNSYSGSWTRKWDVRLANTLTMSLWKSGRNPDLIYTKDQNEINNYDSSRDYFAYSRFVHRGGRDSQNRNNCSLKLDIPSNVATNATLVLQQQHIHNWCTSAEVRIRNIVLEKRFLQFEYLPHDTFVRRNGYISNTTNVNNLFELTPASGRGTDATYFVNDTVAYNVKAAAEDKLYKYIMDKSRYGVNDYISRNKTNGFKELPSGTQIYLGNSFFENYVDCFTAIGENRKTYIKPGYNKEALKANISLTQSPDGTAEIGFVNSANKIESLSSKPAYLSEAVILRATPAKGLFYKGYKMEYTDYNGNNQIIYQELEPKNILSGTRDILIDVRYSIMKITPIFTSKPDNYINITIDEKTREFGQKYDEGKIEALRDINGSRVADLVLGEITTLYATAKANYMPVWTTDKGVRYSGNAFDFVLEKSATQFTLSFEKAPQKYTITGYVKAPKVTINTLRGSNYGEFSQKIPRAGVTVAAGVNTSKTDINGKFVIQPNVKYQGTVFETRAVPNTKCTLRLVDGGEEQIREVSIPASGTSVNAGTLTLSMNKKLPYEIDGDIEYSIIGSDGNVKEMVSHFGGIGSGGSAMYRYDAVSAKGHIYFPTQDAFARCVVTFHKKDGKIFREIVAEKDGYQFDFSFDPIKDAVEGGYMSVTMTDNSGNIYGPYDSGISVVNPPSGDFELVEGPDIEMPTADITLPVVKMVKPNFSSGTFQAKFTKDGFEIVVGFDVGKIRKAMEKTIKENNKEKAKRLGKEKDQAMRDEGNDPKDKKNETGSGQAADVEFNLIFACKLSFSYFDKAGKVVSKGTPEAILAMHNALFYLGVTGSAEKDFPFTIYGIPFYVTLAGEVSITVIMDLYAVDANKKKSHFNFDTFSEHPTTLEVNALVPVGIELTLAAGVGNKKIFSAEVGGTLGLDFEWYPWDKGGTGSGNFSAHIAAYILGYQFKANYPVGDFDIFDTTRRNVMFASNTTENEFVRSFVNFGEQDIFEGLDGFSPEGNVDLIKNVLHDSDHKIVGIGNGCTMVVFLANDDDRTDVNTTALYYCIFDGSNFSEPELIHDDETLDISPYVVDAGEKVFITWVDASGTIADENQEIRKILSQVEINGIFYDKATGKLSEIIEITTDSKNDMVANSSMEYSYANIHPQAVYHPESGHIDVFYIKEDYNNTGGSEEETIADIMNGESTIALAEISLDSEEMVRSYHAEENIPDNIAQMLNGQRLVDVGVMDAGPLSDPKIESFAIATDEDYTVFAYQMDLDQEAETTEDTELMLVLRDDKTHTTYAPFRISEGAGFVGKPSFIKADMVAEDETYQTYHLLWRSGDSILYYDLHDLIERGIEKVNNQFSLKADYRPIQYVTQMDDEISEGTEYLIAGDGDGGLFLITSEIVNGNADMFARYYNGEYIVQNYELDKGGSDSHIINNGRWGKNVSVEHTNAGEQNRLVLKDITTTETGGVLVLYDEYQSGDPLGTLKVVGIYPQSSLDSDINLTFDKDYPLAGDEISVDAIIQSNGLLDSENVNVEFFEENNGEKTLLSKEVVNVPAGDSVLISKIWKVPEDMTSNTKIIVEASGNSGEAMGTKSIPTVARAIVSDVSYLYLNTLENEDIISIKTIVKDMGNVNIPKLTIQFNQVDNEIYKDSLNSDGPDIETAYTEIARAEIEDPFLGDNSINYENLISLPDDPDGWIRQIMVRVFDENGTEFELSSKMVDLQPPAPEVELAVPNSSKSVGRSSGGRGESYTYTVKYLTSEGGQIVGMSEQKIQYGEETTEVCAAPNEGYRFKSWSDGVLSQSRIDKITQNMTVTAWFDKTSESEDWENPFTDVMHSDWFYDEVQYAYENGMMKGVSDTCFAPNDKLTRGMFATMLHRLEGEADATNNPFTDVPSNQYYSNAVCWAAEQEIVYGVSETAFAPDEFITREQMAVMIFRYAKVKGKDTDEQWEIILDFTDLADVSEYAMSAVMFCKMKNIMQGDENNQFIPNGNATRAEAAAVFQRTEQNLSD